jgi:BlaI family penicillinase repressor
MRECKLAKSEEKFAELIWQNEPIGSGDLVKLSEKEMNWKKSTTYTVLKKLCEKGIFQNENSVVSSLI